MNDTLFTACGLHWGEHGFDPPRILSELAGLDYTDMNFIVLRPRREPVPDSFFLEAARLLAEKRCYFYILYATQQAPPGEKSHLNAPLVEKMRQIAGPYFLGEMLGETGSSLASKPQGYYRIADGKGENLPPQDFADLYAARDHYLAHVRALVEFDRSVGVAEVASCEATAILTYNLEAGVDTILLELMPGNPELLTSVARGASRAYGRERWGGYVAHEWYGGFRHGDPLKQKRLWMLYAHAYLSGMQLLGIESGFEEISSYAQHHPKDDPVCQNYRDCLDHYHARLRREPRPAGGPLVRTAFVQGHLDAWTGWGGTALWNQFDREEWGHGPAEASWRILDEVYRSRDWHEGANFGGEDLSHAPGFGQYDVVPAGASAEALSRYDWVIFTGWNTMTREIYDTLRAYVHEGGHLLLCAAHLRTGAARGVDSPFLDEGDWAEFLGCRVRGVARHNIGVKFGTGSLLPGVLYPGTDNMVCDPICAGAYADYVQLEPAGCHVAAVYADDFRAPAPGSVWPALVEHQYGKGVVALLAAADYPGSAGVYPLYRTVVKEYLTAGHRACPVQVLCSDKVRFAVYPLPSGAYRVYLLNSDYNLPQEALLRCGTQEITLRIGPAALENADIG